MNQFGQLDQLIEEHGGTIQTFQVLEAGISKPAFYAYVKEKGLEQAAHGIYVSPDAWTDAMYLLHLRCGQAVSSIPLPSRPAIIPPDCGRTAFRSIP